MSIVIPAYSSASTIGDCLKSLISQKYPRVKYEIIVIDSGNDNTEEICKGYEVHYDHKSSKLSAGAARNIGAGIAEGEIVAFLDADCIAPDQWLDHLVKDFSIFHDAFGVLGVYTGGDSDLDKARGGELMSGDKRLGFTQGFIEGNAAFRRAVFEMGCRFGDMTYGECIRLSMDLSQRGMKTVWDPFLKVIHKGHLSYRKMFAMDRIYARHSLMEERGTLAKGIVKLLFLMALMMCLLLWSSVAIFLAFVLFIIPLAYSLTDNIVARKYRLRFLPILISMRLSRLLASAIETLLYLSGRNLAR